METSVREQMHSVTPKAFGDACIVNELLYFSGVPDSTFTEWLWYLMAHPHEFEHRIACNEGAAVAHAAGYHLSTGKTGIVYLQNSGLGNSVNPLTSLTSDRVFGIPMILMIGWRGEPGKPDEPQHKKMGAVMLPLLECLDIPFMFLSDADPSHQLREAKETAQKNSRPVALIVKKGIFATNLERSTRTTHAAGITKEEAICRFLNHFDGKEVVVGTTGKISRVLFTQRELRKQSHQNDFYTVGSMGHASAIGLEIAKQHPAKRVYVFDGDGAALMHTGTLATIGHYGPGNLIHIIFDNGCHESTGGQPTVSSSVDFQAIARACGYRNTIACSSIEDIDHALRSLEQGPIMVHLKVGGASDPKLARPTIPPPEIKRQFMNHLRGHV